jgi:hypothetical protein
MLHDAHVVMLSGDASTVATLMGAAAAAAAAAAADIITACVHVLPAHPPEYLSPIE